MDEHMPAALPTEEDYRRYDRIWRKVSPELDPYPDVHAARPDVTMEPRPSMPPAPPGPRPSMPQGGCMGQAARGMLDMLRESLRDELADAQVYRYLARQAPSGAARRTMQRMAADEARHARMLQTAYYLITGETYRVNVVLPPQPRLPWPDRLRERWHEESRGADTYARAAVETRDACLRRMFAELSADESHHADQLRKLLEQAM